MNDQVYDPWKVAEEATIQPATYFGHIDVDAWMCVLIKGIGKVPYDPQMHKNERIHTAIKIIATPLPSSNLTFTTEREYVEFERQWAGITLPSIKTCGVGLQELRGKWASYQMVQYSTYIKKDTGEEKPLTTFKFLHVYPTEEAAEQATAEFYGNRNDQPEPTPTNGGNDAERDIALKFLPALAAQAGGDPGKLARIIASNPLVSKYFDMNSPEVVALFTPEEAVF